MITKKIPLKFAILFYIAISLIHHDADAETKANWGFEDLFLKIKSLAKKNILNENCTAYTHKWINILTNSLLIVLAEREYCAKEYENACMYYSKLINNNYDLNSSEEGCLIYSLQRRSSCLYHLGRYQESIHDCKLLGDSDDYRVYQTMAACFAKLGRSSHAIYNYKKSLQLEDHWLTYSLLGVEYSKNKEDLNAAYCFKKTILYSLDQDDFEQILSNTTKKIKINTSDLNNEKSRAVSRQRLRNSPINTFDPECGGQHFNLSPAYFDSKKRELENNGYTFIPSALELSEIDNSIWKDIVFIHIPKCRGTSFQLPLQRSYDAAVEVNSQNNFRRKAKLFSYGNIHNSYVLNKIQSFFLRDTEKPPNSIFCSPHGCNWDSLVNSVELKKRNSPLILTILRDPAERLMSNVKHYMYYSTSIEEFREKVNNEFYNFDNCLYRYLFSDFNRACKGSQTMHLKQLEMSKISDRIMCFSMDDDLRLNQVKSLYLSQAGLPNVLHWSRLKDSYDREKKEPSRWPEKEILSEYNRIIDNFGLELDSKIRIASLVNSRNKKLSAPISSVYSCSSYSLHPFTLIIDRYSRYQIVETKSLFD